VGACGTADFVSGNYPFLFGGDFFRAKLCLIYRYNNTVGGKVQVVLEEWSLIIRDYYLPKFFAAT
jgi:hypothetical protein